MKFRKRDGTVEARQCDAEVMVRTPEGVRNAQRGDWIVEDGEESSVWDDKSFMETFEPADKGAEVRNLYHCYLIGYLRGHSADVSAISGDELEKLAAQALGAFDVSVPNEPRSLTEFISDLDELLVEEEEDDEEAIQQFEPLDDDDDEDDEE